ncbi:MAG: hypothetical protein L6Q71_10610, partial [Planctomycetes bacterium]|nr:hypothetical protein [Planctomycetota bacterium]
SAKILPDAKSHYQFLRETDLTQTDARMQEAVRTTVEELMSETIAAMSFISQAEVRIAPPDKRWHVGHMIESAQAKASVIVGLRDQSVLDDAQVAAIVQTVAFSYPTMPEENVVITDLNGNPYRYDGDWTVTANYNKTKVREEVMIAMKAEGALRSFGPRAEATVFIDQATKNEKTTEFLDQEGRPTVRQSREESETEMKRTGPVGAIGEVGPSARETPGMGEFEVKRELAETREDGLLYGTRETVRTEHGKLQIDYSQSAVTVTLNEEHKAKIEPEMQKWITHVSKATKIPVENISIMFAPAFQPMGTGSGMPDFLATILKPENLVKIVLLVLAVGAFVALMLMLKKSAPKPLTLVDENLGEEEAEPMPEVPFLPPVNQLEGNVVREKVVELVRKNPKAAANLVKRWILFGK